MCVRVCMYETWDKDLIALGLWPVLSVVLSHLPCLSPEPSVRVVSRQKDAELVAPSEPSLRRQQAQLPLSPMWSQPTHTSHYQSACN